MIDGLHLLFVDYRRRGSFMVAVDSISASEIPETVEWPCIDA